MKQQSVVSELSLNEIILLLFKDEENGSII